MSRPPVIGDIVFAHSNGVMGKAIRFGERLRWGETPSYWNHVAIVSRVDEDGTAYVTQAEPRGVTNDKSLDSVGTYRLVSLPEGVSREKVLRFAHQEVGSRYGWMSIASIALDIATPNWFPSTRRSNTWVCSALVAEALRAGGVIFSWADIYCVTPAQLFARLTANV